MSEPHAQRTPAEEAAAQARVQTAGRMTTVRDDTPWEQEEQQALQAERT